MSRIRKAYVNTPAGQIHYREAGRGVPLLLVHRNPSSSAMWEPILPMLADRGVYAIAMDMPGYGESYVPTSEQSCDDYASSLLRACGKLGLHRFSVFGMHTGAWVAASMAVAAPRRITRVVLWGIAVFEQEYRDRLVVEAPPVYDESGTAVAEWWRTRRGMSTREFRPEVMTRAVGEMLETGLHRHWGHRAAGHVDMAELLPKIRQPTLVMCGERDNLWNSCEPASRLVSKVRYEVIHDGGADVCDDSPRELASRVARFVTATSAGAIERVTPSSR